ncbi:unnamed protein product [Closterium sp. Naga37s-1]|nr:unnamed protein product [Closterium sp. Naga37s-1]
MDAAALRPHLVRHSLSPAHLSRAPLGRANTASRRAHRLPPLRARASGGGGGLPKGQGLIGLNGQPLSSSPGGTGGGSGSGGMYLPFLKPAERAAEEGLGSVEELLEVVRERRGLWYEYAPAIGALGRQGLSPAAIAEATGMTGVEQSAVTTAAQVRATLSAAQMEPALLAFFDVGGAEALYELRVLAGAQRKEAAEYVAREGLDGKGARDVARAIKEYERRKREADRSHFSAEPGDLARLRSAETQATPMPVVTCAADLQHLPVLPPPQGPFRLFSPAPGLPWVALPSWPALRGVPALLALLLPSPSLLPPLQARQGDGAVLVVVQGAWGEGSAVEGGHYYVVRDAERGGERGLVVVAGGEVAERYGSEAGEAVVGRVVLALLPPDSEEEEEEIDVDDWE